MEKIKELANELKECQVKLNGAKNVLFNEYGSTLRLRVEQICKQLIRGEEEPYTCGDKLSIPFSIAKNGLKKDKYPCSVVKWTVNGENIEVDITAIFRGEEDSCYCFEFPISAISFEGYLDNLTKEADIREAKLNEEKKKTNSQNEIMEKEQLKYLMSKYPDLVKKNEEIKES